MPAKKSSRHGTSRSPSRTPPGADPSRKAEKRPEWSLRLYVAGGGPRSRAALRNLERLCESHIPGRYKIDVIDLRKNPQLAKDDEILAIPTVVRNQPEPVKRVVGDLSEPDRAITALSLDRAR